MRDEEGKGSDGGESVAVAEAARDADFSKLAQIDAQAEKRIAELEQQLSAEHDNYLRALAELENYRRRATKERAELLKYQGERIITDLIEVVDNFDLALKHAKSSGAAGADEFQKGVELIHKLFLDILGRWEVRSESAVGQEFDPNRHEALSRVAVDDAKPGTVVNEFKRAYWYKDKLLRPGSVVVAMSRDDSASSADSEPTSEKDEGQPTE